jgi:hypothetical protein
MVWRWTVSALAQISAGRYDATMPQIDEAELTNSIQSEKIGTISLDTSIFDRLQRSRRPATSRVSELNSSVSLVIGGLAEAA